MRILFTSNSEKPRLSMIRIIQASILIIPLWYSNRTADPFLPPRYFIWSIACFFLFCRLWAQSSGSERDSDRRLFRDPAFISLLLFATISFFSMFSVANPGEGIYQWSKTFLFIAFLYGSAATIGANLRIVLSLTKSIVVSGILVAGIGIWQLFDVSFLDIPGNFIPRATMGNKNLFASALFLYLPFVLYGMTQFRGAWRKGAGVAMLLIAFNILAAGSRAVWLAFGVSGGIVVWAMRRVEAQREEKNSAGNRFGLRIDPRQWHLTVLPALICIFFLTLALTHPKEMIPNAAASTDSMRERAALWGKTVKMAASAPVRGVGPGQWKIHLPAYGSIEKHYVAQGLTHEVVFQRPHNDFLWVLAENGIPGLVCILFFYGVLVQRCHRLLACARESSMRQLGACMLFGLIGYLLISLFSFPRERIFHNLFQALIAAVILSMHQLLSGPRTQAPSVAGRRLERLILVLCFLCVLLGYGRLRADMQAGGALLARDARQWEKVVEHVDRAYAWYYTLDPLGTPLAWYRGMAHYRLGNLDLARNDFENACRDHPFHFHSLINAAACHALAGDRAAALNYRQRARNVMAQGRSQICTTGDGRPDDRLLASSQRDNRGRAFGSFRVPSPPGGVCSGAAGF